MDGPLSGLAVNVMFTGKRGPFGGAAARSRCRVIDHTRPIAEGIAYVPSTGREPLTSTPPAPSAWKTACDRDSLPSRQVISAATLTLDDGVNPVSRIVSGASCKADVGLISIRGAAAPPVLGRAIATAPAPISRLRRVTFVMMKVRDDGPRALTFVGRDASEPTGYSRALFQVRICEDTR